MSGEKNPRLCPYNSTKIINKEGEKKEEKGLCLLLLRIVFVEMLIKHI